VPFGVFFIGSILLMLLLCDAMSRETADLQDAMPLGFTRECSPQFPPPVYQGTSAPRPGRHAWRGRRRRWGKAGRVRRGFAPGLFKLVDLPDLAGPPGADAPADRHRGQ
jgi:hypothetical protein